MPTEVIDMDERVIRLLKHVVGKVHEAVALRADLADCCRTGIIYGVHLTYSPIITLPPPRVNGKNQEEYTNDDVERRKMIMDAIKTGRVEHLRRGSSLIEHYFIGRSRPDLTGVLAAAGPYGVGSYGGMTGGMGVAVFPQVGVFDPRKVGVDDEIPEIGALLRSVGIPDQYIDGKVRIFSS